MVQIVVEVVKHRAAAHRQNDEVRERQHEHRNPGPVLEQIAEVFFGG